MKTDGWGTFMMTGRVSDYLNYKLQGSDAKSSEYTGGISGKSYDGEMRGGQVHGTERCSYRYGASDDANW